MAIAAPAASSTDAAVLTTVGKSAQEMTVEVDGATRWQWKVSTGRSGHDTPNGTFRAVSMDADHYSKKYDDAPMPHSIFFTNAGHAIHGSFAVRRLGTPASHGCVRVEPANATKPFALVAQQGMRNTAIVITGDAARGMRRMQPRGRALPGRLRRPQLPSMPRSPRTRRRASRPPTSQRPRPRRSRSRRGRPWSPPTARHSSRNTPSRLYRRRPIRRFRGPGA